MSEIPQYDRDEARRQLAGCRSNRRSLTTEKAAALCVALGYTIEKKRGKGSHIAAVRPGAPTITIPKVFGLRIATGILTTLEEVFDRDGSDEVRNA